MLSTSAAAEQDATPSTTPLKAVLWDMDGTLVDTEPHWIAAEYELVAAHGGYWDDELSHSLVGSALDNSAKVIQKAGVKLSVREIIDELSARVIEGVRRDLPWRPGARELLADLHGRGVRCALVTMSERPLAEEIIGALDKEYFEFLITGDEVENGKPHPEPYLLAVERMRESDPTITIEQCVALEDSIPGVASAVASGAATIAIPNAIHVAQSPQHTTWDTLAGKTYDDVATVVASHNVTLGVAL